MYIFSEVFILTETVVRKVNVPGDMVSSLTLWDLPGTEDMDLRESYYRNADAAIGNLHRISVNL